MTHFSRWIVLLLSSAVALPASGGTIRHDRNDTQYTNLAAATDNQAVGKLEWNEAGTSPLASGVLIRHNWVLTAAHVVDGTDGFGAGISNLQFDTAGNVFPADAWLAHSQWHASGGESNLFAGWDIGLVRLSAGVPGIVPAELFSASDGDELGRAATLVGFGQTGDGISGAVAGTAGTRRAGNNIVDLVGTRSTPGSLISGFGHERMLAVDFDNPDDPFQSTLGAASPLNLEYLTAPGDSGGGLFLDVDGTRRLAGVTSLGSTLDGAANSDYGDRGAYTRVSQFAEWISSTIAANTPPAIPGDYNSDGNVSPLDHAFWGTFFGQQVLPASGADGNGNGLVDAADFTFWREHYTASSAAAGAVVTTTPEPSAWVLMALALVGIPAGGRWTAVRTKRVRKP